MLNDLISPMSDKVELMNGKIVRSPEPLNLEMRFNELDGFITPTELFYVRTRFPLPKIDKSKWRLRVEGEVKKPLEFTFDDLLSLELRTVPVTLECAGNNRSFLRPEVKGVQWGLGAVGTAEWTGVPLSVLLDLAGLKASAEEVILEGADGGTLEDPKSPAGPIKFARSIPLNKARQDVLLVYQMNGRDLPPEHGYPLRAIVPGWYAMASIKWLQRIIVIEGQFNGYYQTLDYAYWRRDGDLARLSPLSAMQVKAQIAKPSANEAVARDSTVAVRGAAWTSDGVIAKVEVSADGGASWNPAKLIGTPTANAWQLWQFDWHTPSNPGKQILIARATDSRGRTQPMERDRDRGTYMISHLLPIEVEVQ
jgi:DMSO/TMAO reductase YedYZ molybdopterin-dependent catalytic subunit